MSKKIFTGHGLNAAQKGTRYKELNKPMPNGKSLWWPNEKWAKRRANRILRHIPFDIEMPEMSDEFVHPDVPIRAAHIWAGGEKMMVMN